MNEQINLFEYMGQKPPVGSRIFFIECNKIHEAVVIAHDIKCHCGGCKKYFKVREPSGQTWNIVNYYTSRAEARERIK